MGDDDEVAREPPDKQRPSLPSSVPRSRRTRKRHLDELGHLRRVLAEELGPRLQFGQRLGAADTTTLSSVDERQRVSIDSRRRKHASTREKARTQWRDASAYLSV